MRSNYAQRFNYLNTKLIILTFNRPPNIRWALNHIMVKTALLNSSLTLNEAHFQWSWFIIKTENVNPK